MPHSILLVDDEPKMRDVLSVALGELGYRALTAASGEEALEILDREEVDLVLSDLRMKGMHGRELLREIKRRWPNLPVVLMTAYSSVKDAVQAIKEGAFDYIDKPFEMEDLATTLANGLRLYDVLRDNQRLRAELEDRHSFESLIGNSPVFRRVIVAIAEVCDSRTSVLVTGESGTGKEMVARAIHFNSSRKTRPFVALNCAAIPEGLLESELFGHVRGAFTGATANRVGRFQQADGGTLFLDEIGDMPLAVQAKMLRVLQDRTFEPVGSTTSRTVDVRIVSATNKDLQVVIRDGSFRDDLYYRLNVFPIALPPLRERLEDLPLLVDHFTRQIVTSMGKRLTGFSPAALRAMAGYRWPGNVRELQNCIERSIIVARGASVEVDDLPAYLFDRRDGKPVTPETTQDLDAELARIERQIILDALGKTGGVQITAAELLGISERSLWHRIKKLGIHIVKRTAE